MAYVYPANDLDRPDKLLRLLGSFWSSTYQGVNLVFSSLSTRAQLDAQAYRDFLELIASISRFNVPVFHRENWHFLTFLESQVNNFGALVSLYDNAGIGQTYDAATNLKYGVPPETTTFSVPCPADLRTAKVVMNRIADPSLVWTDGIDFWRPANGVLTFRENPFNTELIHVQEVFEEGQVVDRLGGLWVYHGDYDWNIVYEQFGYAIRTQMQSSEGYKSLLNAIFDAMVHGTSSGDYHRAWSAITGIPLAADTETVETIVSDVRSLCVITDKHAYKFPLGSIPVVAAGDRVRAGDPLVDTLQFFEFNRGQTPENSDLSGLALGRGFLAAGYLGDLTFENNDVPLVVEQDDEGYTKVSFEIKGYPGDVEKFWEDVHAAGRAKGQTLANLLDQRANPIGEPTAAMLPVTINPLEFLCQNLLRYHGFVVKIRASKLGRQALGIWSADNFRKIVPPETAMIIVVELDHADEPIIMNGPGNETHPGYDERVSGFPCMVVSESIDGSTIRERVRAFQIRGKCK